MPENKLLCSFIEITLRHGCSPANLLHIFRTPFLKNTFGWLFQFRASCWRISWGCSEILHEFLWFTPRKPVTTKVGRRYYCYQYLVTGNCKSSFVYYEKPGGGTDGSKMIIVIVIIHSYQNERLKAYNTLLDMLFISFIY